jgi:hypothetical protein
MRVEVSEANDDAPACPQRSEPQASLVGQGPAGLVDWGAG